ncbi:hypothetical protein ATKI12_5952 [Kitasatospora sp. Ki12]
MWAVCRAGVPQCAGRTRAAALRRGGRVWLRGGSVQARPVRMGAAIGDRVAKGAAAAWKEL